MCTKLWISGYFSLYLRMTLGYYMPSGKLVRKQKLTVPHNCEVINTWMLKICSLSYCSRLYFPSFKTNLHSQKNRKPLINNEWNTWKLMSGSMLMICFTPISQGLRQNKRLHRALFTSPQTQLKNVVNTSSGACAYWWTLTALESNGELQIALCLKCHTK